MDSMYQQVRRDIHVYVQEDIMFGSGSNLVEMLISSSLQMNMLQQLMPIVQPQQHQAPAAPQQDTATIVVSVIKELKAQGII